MCKKRMAAAAALLLAAIMVFGLWQGIRPMIVVSGSMEPNLPVGSLCLIDTRYRDIRQGEIITFDFGKEKITHRVIGVLQEGYVTRGDANGVQDFAPVRRHQVYGKLAGHIPYVGYVIAVLQRYGPIGAAAGMGLYFVWRLQKGRESSRWMANENMRAR